MAATIKIKNSSTASAVPTSSDLVQGELAVNVTDKRLFTENASGTVVELGTNPTILTLPDGSASAPTLTNDGDTNTGIFFPAADTVGIATGGSERARVDSSGNLGLGVTPSAWAAGLKGLQVGANSYASAVDLNNGVTVWGSNFYNDGANKFAYSSGRYALQILQDTTSGAHSFRVSNATGSAGGTVTFTTAMTLDASSNLSLIGSLTLGSAGVSSGIINSADSLFFNIDSDNNDGTNANVFAWGRDAATSGATRLMTLGADGNLLVGTTSGVGNERFNTTQSNSTAFVARIINSNASPGAGLIVNYSAGAPNGTGNEFVVCSDNAANRFIVRSNGGIANYSANNVNLSDRREKTNFAPAGDYLAKICAIPVQTFNYIDQNLEEDDGLTLGVVAQDVQAVAPELVLESNWAGKDEEPKMRLSIYQTDLQYALMKALQELKAEFDAYKASHP